MTITETIAVKNMFQDLGSLASGSSTTEVSDLEVGLLVGEVLRGANGVYGRSDPSGIESGGGWYGGRKSGSIARDPNAAIS
jgi:hypothetical protein